MNVSRTELKGTKELFFPLKVWREACGNVAIICDLLGDMRMDCHGASLWLTSPGSSPLSPECKPLGASATCQAEEL